MSIDNEVGRKEYHYAIVTRVEDRRLKARLRGAVFIKSDTLTGGSEWPDAIQPSFPLAGQNGEGFFWVPQIGDQIEIEIDAADEHPVPKYVRMIYSDEDDIAAEFKENYPFRMGWRSRVGHIFYMDNKEDFLAVKLAHKIGTGFEWDKDGNEIKTIMGELRETIEKKVMREIKGQVEEMFKAEVTRTYDAKVLEKFKADLKQEIQGALKIEVKKAFELKANSSIKMETPGSADFKGTGGTNLGSGGSATNVDGSVVNLGGGGVPVARLGDPAVGIGAHGVKVASTIVGGSSKVTSS